jgi:hypothetical protein
MANFNVGDIILHTNLPDVSFLITGEIGEYYEILPIGNTRKVYDEREKMHKMRAYRLYKLGA